MNKEKVLMIMNKSELALDNNGVYHSDKYSFVLRYVDFCDGVKVTKIVYMVEMIRKGDYKDALSDYNNSIFIKTLKELKQRVSNATDAIII